MRKSLKLDEIGKNWNVDIFLVILTSGGEITSSLENLAIMKRLHRKNWCKLGTEGL